MPVGYSSVSSSQRTVRPDFVVVAAMRSTMIWWVLSGRPVTCQGPADLRRCTARRGSTARHGGGRPAWMASPVAIYGKGVAHGVDGSDAVVAGTGQVGADAAVVLQGSQGPSAPGGIQGQLVTAHRLR